MTDVTKLLGIINCYGTLSFHHRLPVSVVNGIQMDDNHPISDDKYES